MKHRILPALSLATLLLACAHDPNKREVSHARTVDNDSPRAASGEDALPADSDRVSAGGEPELERASDEKLTVLDQGNDEVDIDLTQRIRKAVMAEDWLSFGAKNVKIITKGGHVTLRGEVNSAAEKGTIYDHAVAAAGTGHVTNQLEIDD